MPAHHHGIQVPLFTFQCFQKDRHGKTIILEWLLQGKIALEKKQVLFPRNNPKQDKIGVE